ncbi:MAG: hypothetical protein H7A49_11700 [Akkermansiaceae bacterium]|nr:hypothetical protein [Akkermansiaceae bacterium]MCP5544557.1 hypothetical protein [Akkermansiaceae bacterium]MCP5547975.1 hypothetical protein [Akkermansiaceae bacterium]
MAAAIAGFGTAPAAVRTWIGGNSDWIDGGLTTNWSPADEPDADDEAVFNTANALNLGTNNTILALTMSGGIDLSTNDFDLAVDGLVQLTGASTNLFINASAGSVNADNVTINSGGTVELRGGLLTLDEESGTSLLDLNTGGSLFGNGVITFADTPVLTTTLLTNDGTLTALSRSVLITLPPPVGTLQINDSSIGGRINLDGSGEAGVVNVNRNQTLDLNIPLSDSFSGTMNLFQESVFDSSAAWTLDTGVITIDNGATGGIGGAPAGTATIAGGAFTQIGGTISVVDADGTLEIDAPFTMTGGSLTNFGTVAFNGETSITTAPGYAPSALDAQTIVNANVTIDHAAGIFNWDGNGASDTTVNGTAKLSLIVNKVDSNDDVFGGTITLNDDGALGVDNAANNWTVGGSLIKNGTGTSTITGDPVIVSGSLAANAGTLTTPVTTLSAGANVSVAGTLSLGGGSVIAGPASVAGAGQLRFLGASTVTASTTIGTTTFDWDGSGSGSLHTINDGVVFTINSTVWDPDDAGDMDDPINLGGNSASLAVNNIASWTMNRTLTTNTSGLGIASLDGGSRMILNGALGIWNANGQTVATVPVTFGAGSTANIAGAGYIRLSGGNNLSIFNRIEGAVISGAGPLAATSDRVLSGFGTINSPVTFLNTSSLLADDGTLTINGVINSVPTIGTADVDGVLDVVNAWNTSVAGNVSLRGGVLQGGTITNSTANGISGHGLVSSKVLNNSRLNANFVSETLVVETAANDNDWDGAGNTGLLRSQGTGAVLELRDTATFGFSGAVEAGGGGTVFSNGFALDFNPGSTLQLNNGGTYRSTNSTDLGGNLIVGAGAASTLNVEDNRFLIFQPGSTTTLNADLHLQNNNINIDAGATFSGAGALIIDQGSHLIIDANGDVDVLVDNRGTFRPAGFFTVGRTDVRDYQQSATGNLFCEIAGTALNQFDRVVVNGAAVLGGVLNLSIQAPFNPTPGDTFHILTASGGVTGQFAGVVVTNMPSGMVLEVNYLPNAVQVEVVAGTYYDSWILTFPSLVNPADRLRTADPDGDGRNNLLEFGLDGDPSKPDAAKIYPKIAAVGGVDAFTLTCPMRFTTVAMPPAPPLGPVTMLEPEDQMDYIVEASDTLVGFPVDVDLVEGDEATAIQSGLPPVNPGWSYRTFRSEGPVAGDPAEFMRVGVSE